MATGKTDRRPSAIPTKDELRDELEARGWPCRVEGKSVRVYCPVHGGGALTISDGDNGKAVLHCFACEDSDSKSGKREEWFAKVLQSLRADDPPEGYVFSPNGHGSTGGGQYWGPVVAEYMYQDADGKDFLSRRKYILGTMTDGVSDKIFTWDHKWFEFWKPGLGGNDRILYRLPELLASDEWEPVYLVEGEKDVEALRHRGYVATTAGGARDWLPEFAEYFAGRHVVLVPDQDEAGLKAAESIAEDLLPVVKRLERMDLPYEILPAHGKDVSDWFEDGNKELPEATLVRPVEEVAWTADDRVTGLDSLGGLKINSTMAEIMAVLKALPPLPADRLEVAAATVYVADMLTNTGLLHTKAASGDLAKSWAMGHPRKAKAAASHADPPPAPVDMPAIAKEEDILERFSVSIDEVLVGERDTAMALFLVLVSRVLRKPVNLVIKGESSSGKSIIVKLVLRYFSDTCYWERTSFSPKALIYSDEDFRHHYLVLFEADTLQGEDAGPAAEIIRTLLSEQRIIYEVVVTNPGGAPYTEVFTKPGPTGLVTTTTSAELHAENETRLLSINADDSPDQTRGVIRRVGAQHASGEFGDEQDLSEWIQLCDWITQQDNRVVFPLAVEVADLIAESPSIPQMRMRRDIDSLFGLVEAHAILHQASRERDDRGRIIATAVDYEAVRRFAGEVFAEGAGITVSKSTKEAVEAVGAVVQQKFEHTNDERVASTEEVAARLKVKRRTAERRLKVAAADGYIRNVETRYRQEAKWILGYELPDGKGLLPELPGGPDAWD